MILRRFSEHVKNDSWLAVGVDLIVVGVGIYIGLQADAFMSAQRDRGLEREYLQRLLAGHGSDSTISADLTES
jgi:hypothetical protein